MSHTPRLLRVREQSELDKALKSVMLEDDSGEFVIAASEGYGYRIAALWNIAERLGLSTEDIEGRKIDNALYKLEELELMIERMEKAEAVNESLTSALIDIKKNVDDWNLQDYVTIRRLVNAAIRGMEEKMSVGTGVKWQLQRTPYESEIDIVSDGRTIATVEAGEDKEKIARFIVAAPDMLAVLEKLSSLLVDGEEYVPLELREELTTAIKKARGEV